MSGACENSLFCPRMRLMDVVNLDLAPSFITKDGSEIRELLAYRNSAIRYQSLAEARLPAGGATQEHYHVKTEEIYYITHGRGRIKIEGATREVGPGDAIAIPPGQRHQLWNIGEDILRVLCCCAPPYEHDDTVMTEVGELSNGHGDESTTENTESTEKARKNRRS